MLNIGATITWMFKKSLNWLTFFPTYFLPPFLGVLDIAGCLLRFFIWIVIFSVSSLLNVFGFFFLAAIWILGQLRSLLEPSNRQRRRRRPVGNHFSRRARSQDLASSHVRNGHSSPMDYDDVIRTTRGLYTCRGGFSRSRRESPSYWLSDRYDYDSSYFTDSPRTISEASWSTGRSRFNKAII